MSKSPLPGEHRCDCCGIDFFKRPESIYTFVYKKHIRHFCGWTCYEKCLKLKKAKKYEELDRILDEVIKYED